MAYRFEFSTIIGPKMKNGGTADKKQAILFQSGEWSVRSAGKDFACFKDGATCATSDLKFPDLSLAIMYCARESGRPITARKAVESASNPQLDASEINFKLTHALTAYDRRESTKRGYNRYALSQYFARLEEVMADIGNGTTPRKALVNAFNGRLLDCCLRAIGEWAVGKGSLSARPATGF